MEKHLLQQNVVKFVQDDEKAKSIKFDIAFKAVVKNLALMILVGLITEILLTIKSQFLYAFPGIALGLISGSSNFFTLCQNSSAEKRIKIILAHSCIGAFSLTLIFFFELIAKVEKP